MPGKMILRYITIFYRILGYIAIYCEKFIMCYKINKKICNNSMEAIFIWNCILQLSQELPAWNTTLDQHKFEVQPDFYINMDYFINFCFEIHVHCKTSCSLKCYFFHDTSYMFLIRHTESFLSVTDTQLFQH